MNPSAESALRRRPTAAPTPAAGAEASAAGSVPLRSAPPRAPVARRYVPWRLTWRTYAMALVLLAGAFLVRTFQIGQPNEVVFDEVHFGKFASFYVTRRYFFDVHPPLAKLLMAFGAWLAGFDGSFEFDDIGLSYDKAGVPYRAMRMLPAVLGSLQVPLVYLILRETGVSNVVGAVCALCVLLDNAHVLQTRLILLDAPLVLFMLLSLYGYVKFYQARYVPFTPRWWAWLSVTGVGLALTISCKMVGVLTFLTIGGAVAYDLWLLLDIRRGLSLRRVVKHVCARVTCLLVLPLCVYLFWFYVHFAILTKSGPGDTFMSPQFQQTLEGNELLQNSLELHYFDAISLQHRGTNAYLHSHEHHYPLRYDDGRISSEGQQVTAYQHPDSNNMWRIMPVWPVDNDDGSFNVTKRRIYHGAPIRLMHVGTNSFLLAHDVASPLMPTNEEFTTVPAENLDDELRDTVFELTIEDGVANRTTWHSRRSRVRLIHADTRVAMWTHADGVLPAWGFGQLEVNGVKNAQERTALWSVDDVHPDPTSPMFAERAKPPAQPEAPKPLSFLTKYLELQKSMLEHNNRLVQSHPYMSRPLSWPVLYDGVLYWSQDATRRQLALYGNLVSWWGALLGVALAISIGIVDVLSRRRGIHTLPHVVRQRYLHTTGFFVYAWACHYLPFFLMQRQLFLHHYLPAHVCSVLALGGVLELVLTHSIDLPLSAAGPALLSERRRPPMSRRLGAPLIAVAAALAVALVAMFVYMAPLTYGHVGLTVAQVQARRWLPSWRLQFAK